MRKPERGFTLVEMMTVVAVIGIVVALAIPSLRTTADVEATARNMASLIGEAARTAISRGPIPAEVAEQSGSSDRIRVSISSSHPHEMTVELQYEQPNNGNYWYVIQKTVLPRGVRVAGEMQTSDLGITDDGSGGGGSGGSGMGSGGFGSGGSGSGSGSGGGGGSGGSAGGGFAMPDFDSTTVRFYCRSTGECDPRTIYLSRTEGNLDRYRVVVLPLATAPHVLKGW